MDSETRLALASVLFAVVAAYSLYSGFTTPTAVPTEAGYTANLELMHIQSTNLAVGIGATIVSALFSIGSAIVGVINRSNGE